MLVNTRQLAMQNAQEIRETMILAALALRAIEGRQEDDISENDAFKRYKKAWIKSRVSMGMIHFTRVGSGSTSTKFYSVFEIETLKIAEKRLTEAYEVALKQHTNIVTL